MGNRKGLVISELAVVMAVLLVLGLVSFKLVAGVLAKAKRVTVRGQMTQLALILECVRDDTGGYPASINDLARTRNDPPSGLAKGWNGPYLAQAPRDPWGGQYLYEMAQSTRTDTWVAQVLPPVTVIRYKGTPETEYFDFTASAGPGTVRVENHSLTSCDICVRDAAGAWTEVVHECEFKNHPDPQYIQDSCTLLAGVNAIKVRARSTKGDYCIIQIVATVSETKPVGQPYFTLTNYGRDGVSGGKGLNEDSQYVSNKYPNFR